MASDGLIQFVAASVQGAKPHLRRNSVEWRHRRLNGCRPISSKESHQTHQCPVSNTSLPPLPTIPQCPISSGIVKLEVAALKNLPVFRSAENAATLSSELVKHPAKVKVKVDAKSVVRLRELISFGGPLER